MLARRLAELQPEPPICRSTGGAAMSDRPWFQTRASGLGWTPVTWEGWLATILSAAAAVALNIGLVVHLAAMHR
jgi:hypothetical protein